MVKNRIKVLMICTVDFGKNGIANWILNYAEKISGSGEIEIGIVAPNIANTPDVYERIKKADINLVDLPLRKKNVFKYFLCLVKKIRQKKYDIIHAHGNSCTLSIELLAALIAGCRIRIAHSHNTSCTHMIGHKALRPIFEICCTDRFACGEEAGKWLFKNKPFEILWNGVDLKKYQYNPVIRDAVRKEKCIEEKIILLGMVGAFVYQKNHFFLIELMKRLEDAASGRFRLLLVGEGEYRQEFESRVKKEGLQNVVILTGNVADISKYLQALDCFLLPSFFEGLPFVLIEAQVAGLPCIVSDKVSREVAITDEVSFLPIDRGEEVWEKKILNMQFDRRAFDKDLKCSEYNMDVAAVKLEKMYKSLIERY